MAKKPKPPPKTDLQLDGTHIAAFNEMSPGAGNALAQILASIQNTVNTQAGHHGKPTLAVQSGTDSKGVALAGLTLNNQRIEEVADPKNDLDAMNLRTARRMMPDLDDVDDVEGAIKRKRPCRPVSLSNMKTAITGMTEIFAVEAQREFVYVCGADGFIGAFQVYRILSDFNSLNEVKLVGSITPTEIFQRMVLVEHYIFGCRTNGGSNNLTVIDVKRPDDPVEVAVFNVGAACKGIFATGRFVYIACGGAVKIVDCAVPTAPKVSGSAA